MTRRQVGIIYKLFIRLSSAAGCECDNGAVCGVVTVHAATLTGAAGDTVVAAQLDLLPCAGENSVRGRNGLAGGACLLLRYGLCAHLGPDKVLAPTERSEVWGSKSRS